ncbi:MAG: hypothetical protein E6J34_01535 [Chloroflexi bacterium]|nr:MAG: hypothetical protein E6J34_01535 [Chloroflexota bacterium]
MLMANVRPGEYPLWGATYLRWWLYGKIMALSPAGLLTGSPFLPPFLRLLGAKVGRNCHFASGAISMPMFVEIEDDVSIGYGVQVLPYAVQDGRLHIAPIHIGRDTFIGTNSIIEGGAKIGSGVAILEQSLVHADQVIPDNEAWGGSPIKRQETVRSLLTILASTVDKRPWPFSILVGFFFGIIFVMLLPTLMVLPSVLLISLVALRAGTDHAKGEARHLLSAHQLWLAQVDL